MIVLLSITLSIANACFAQNSTKSDYDSFVLSFRSKIGYPTTLIKNCTSTACLIKVQVDDSKNVINMELSDSADSLLVIEFKHDKMGLNLKSLESYLKSKYSNEKQITFLIPLSYGIRSTQCPIPSVSIQRLNNYEKFNGNYLTGNIIFLDPIYSEIGFQR